jgi:hypothetical protein
MTSGYQALVSLTKGENKAMRRFPDALRRIASRPGFPRRTEKWLNARND